MMAKKVDRQQLFRGFSSYDAITPTTETIDIELIKRDLLNHFNTKRGERVMRPNFGSLIWDLLFDPFDDMVKESIMADAKNIISQESRVSLRSLDVFEYEHGLRLDIEVFFVPFRVLDTFEVSFDKRNSE